MTNVTDPNVGITDGHPEFVANGNPASNPADSVVINDSSLTKDAAGNYVVTKGGTTTFGVHLASQPAASVTVNVQVDKLTGSCTASPASLTFTTGNFGSDQTVTVTGVSSGDSIIEAAGPAGYGRAHVRVSVRG